VIPGARWLELLLRHVRERYEHLVRYVGWYSNRARGERAKAANDRTAHGLGAEQPGREVAESDARDQNQAFYMLRAPLSPAKMTYDPASGTVIYRSKMHLGLKRNFQVMSGAEWLELLCKHIPDRYEQLVRYCGWHSSRSRGIRKAKGACLGSALGAVAEPLGQYASRAKAAWARLIRKVYEADPLECPKCKGPMRVICRLRISAIADARFSVIVDAVSD
jgi:hypothetical protein